ncbi:LOW QUALITY PROTEIN: synaptotagmin-like protein 2 [Sceloporus undulatus]|uniref:LOW QUALITY PROTEIN: synaptotagmin-like protein 2 n=1 Tax=Sceloporus undulatus TaxID=8520 RepID=UPI001C4CACB8|nr:LOW QUALITY PROTEIN: synaptotagmin-like protein 2 [Sceloporus undulatus]
MIDLSFLTDEEQEAILKVLQRDADLKRAEEERIRHLPEKIKDDSQVKNMSGQWFYEVKSKRHREKINGADIIRASIRRKPLKTAFHRLISSVTSFPVKSQFKSGVNPKVLIASSNTLQKPREDTRKAAVSPSNQRKNPFNDSTLLEDNMKTEQPENRMTGLSEGSDKDTHLPSVENQPRVTLTNHSRLEGPEQAPAGLDKLQIQAGKPPVPKARKNIHKTSDVSLSSEDSFSKSSRRLKQANGQGTPPRGILKRSSSSSSTDSEVLRVNQTLDPPSKSGLPPSAILEDVAEKDATPAAELEGFSQNSLERLKQVRFSSSVSRKERPQSLELQEGKESGEFTLLDSDYVKTSDNPVDGLDVLQNGETQPAKPPRSHFPALNDNIEDRGVSQEEETALSSYNANSSDPSQPVQSPIVKPILPSESPGKILPRPGEEQTADMQIKTKHLSPEPDTISKSTTGQQLPLATKEEPQAPKVGSADLEQGKPALVEGQSAKTTSKPDKHAVEILKAADESISKVLDWFKRSSSTSSNETILLSPQERELAEEMDKSRGLPVTREDDRLSTIVLNRDSSTYEKEEPTNKDYDFHAVVNQPDQLSFAEIGSPISLLVREQKDYNQSNQGSNNQGQDIHIRPYLQTIDQGLNETKGTGLGAEHKTEVETPSHSELEPFQDNKMKLDLKSFDSSVKRKKNTHAYTDGERDVKSLLEEHQPRESEGKRSEFLNGVNMQHANRGNLSVVQEQESKQSSLTGYKKRVKDIKAFWEGEKITQQAANKEDLVTGGRTVSNTVLNDKKESSTAKQMGGSSGYVTGESDNEQSKYSKVTFRKIELSDDDTEPKNNDFKLSSEKMKPSPMDNSKRSHFVDRSAKTLPSEQKYNEFTEQLGRENLQLRHKEVSFSKGDGGLQAGALQQKHHFKIHSLKEKIDEESRAQMLNPSQFQSLRSFWGAGTKPMSKTDEEKVKTIIPRNRNRSTGSYQKESEELKKVRVENSQAVWEGEQQKPIFIEKRLEEPNAKVSPVNVLETSQVFPNKARQPALLPSVDAVPMGSLEFALPEADYSKAPQHNRMVLADTDRKDEVTGSEVIETVNRTLVPSKHDADIFNISLERLLKEISGVKTSSSHPTMMDVSDQAVSLSQKSPFFSKVMELSHGSYPGSQYKSGLGPQGMEGVVQKHDLQKDQSAEFKRGTGSLPATIEESSSLPGRASNMEEDGVHQDDIPSQKKVFEIPSLKLILPDASLVAQNRANSPTEEVSETVTGINIPSTRKCSDLNARLVSLLKESPEMPCISASTQNILKKQFDHIAEEDQQRSCKKVSEKSIPVSTQMANSPQDSITEATEGSRDAHEVGGSEMAIVLSEPTKEATLLLPLRNQKNVEAETYASSIDKQPKDVAEIVVNTIKSNAYDLAAFRANLSKLLKEDSEDREVLISTNAPLSTHMQSVFGKDGPYHQEIIEIVEKAAVPSNSRQVGLKAHFQKLLKEDSEIQPEDQKNIDNSTRARMERESNQNVRLVCQQQMNQEVNESVNKTVVPSKVKQREFHTGLQKLLEEAGQMPPAQLGCLDAKIKENMQVRHSLESMMDLPQEADENVIKSIAPGKDDDIFKSILEKLLREHADATSQSSMEVHDNSTFRLEKQSSSVKLSAPITSVSSDYRTEVKIPLKGKSFKQDNQTIEVAKVSGVPETSVVFQKTAHVNLASSGAQPLEKGEDSPTHSRTDESKQKYEREREDRVSRPSASLEDGNEIVTVMPGSQRSSTPLLQKDNSPQISKVELLLASPNADDSEDDYEDARSFGSDLSDENNSSFVRIQRSRIRSEEGLNPVMEALKRSSNREIPSKSLEDIPSATSNEGKVNFPREDLILSAEDDQKIDQPHETHENASGISTAPSFPNNNFSHPEKVKQMSKSVPAFLQDESDDRETDTASDSSYPLGRIKKSPSSLTNLSGSSGLASLSSVSTSVMSVYSGDFGNVDVKGNIQFAIDYVDQLKEFHIFIAQGKDLAVADVKKQRSDPYVKSYLLPEKNRLGKRKTSVKKKTLNPVYNEILRYKVDKELLATQKLNISVWHNDTFGRNSFLGEVELDLRNWDWNEKQNRQMNWYPLKPRTPLSALELENRGEIKIALQYIPQPAGGKKTPTTGEVHIWVKECNDLPILRGNRLNSFVKCTILPDTSRKSRQKTRAVPKTTNPVFNHTMVYDGFRPEDLKEACVELTVWDHNKLANHFLGGLRIGLGTGKSYGTPVDWMDSTLDEASLWERMIDTPNTWVEDTLPLRMLTMTKNDKIA